jgi:hypothetical protein
MDAAVLDRYRAPREELMAPGAPSRLHLSPRARNRTRNLGIKRIEHVISASGRRCLRRICRRRAPSGLTDLAAVLRVSRRYSSTPPFPPSRSDSRPRRRQCKLAAGHRCSPNSGDLLQAAPPLLDSPRPAEANGSNAEVPLAKNRWIVDQQEDQGHADVSMTSA